MAANLDSARFHASFEGLGAVRAAARAQRPEAAEAVARELEGMFVQMMLGAMRATTSGDGLLDSPAMDLYTDMFDRRIARAIAARDELGIAALLRAQLGARAEESAPGGPFAPRYWHGEPRQPQVHDAPAASGAGNAVPAASPEQFVAALAPLAQQAAAQLGTSPRVLLAQSALETGWGQRVIRRPDGSSSHNLFGIKADAGWGGARVRVPTLEYEHGIARRQHAEFRVYDTPADSFADYVRFLHERPHYAPALATASDPQRFVRGLQDAGYATDPHYADKVVRIMQQIDAPLAPVVQAQR